MLVREDFIVPPIVHCVAKNVPPLTCYNLDIHDRLG